MVGFVDCEWINIEKWNRKGKIKELKNKFWNCFKYREIE